MKIIGKKKMKLEKLLTMIDEDFGVKSMEKILKKFNKKKTNLSKMQKKVVLEKKLWQKCVKKSFFQSILIKIS